jgi:hypothetical protein
MAVKIEAVLMIFVHLALIAFCTHMISAAPPSYQTLYTSLVIINAVGIAINFCTITK